MFGTALLVAGLAGLAFKVAQGVFTHDVPEKFNATVAKTRLDTKKIDGAEFYTYILTFFVHEKNRYISFNVPQKQFDETIEKDSGILLCNFEKRRFLGWTAKKNV